MEGFSLFSFNSLKSSLAYINNKSKNSTDWRTGWCKPDECNDFDIPSHGMKTWNDISDTCTSFPRENTSGSDCKNENAALPVCEEKKCSDEKHDVEVLKHTRTRWKRTELILTLRPEQCGDIVSRFEELNYTVKILPIETKQDSYVVVFPGRLMAEKALAEANIIGYKLTRKRLPRPSPRCPIMFRALYRLKIRSGKALSREAIGWVKKNDLVIVNQVKGRRARLIVAEEGRIFIWGWVSLYTSNGLQLLEQTDVDIDVGKLLDDGEG